MTVTVTTLTHTLSKITKIEGPGKEGEAGDH